MNIELAVQLRTCGRISIHGRFSFAFSGPEILMNWVEHSFLGLRGRLAKSSFV